MCCKDKTQCSCPEKPRPNECTPEQIRECHGEMETHPCENQGEERPSA